MKKILKRVLLGILVLVVVAIGFVLITFPSIMAGMVSKTVCSCVFVTGRDVASVRAKELKVFPTLDKAGIDLNMQDSTVTASVLWTSSKSIFRKGLGCTLLSQMPEAELRQQQMALPAPAPNLDSLPWPMGNVVKDTMLANVKYDAVKAAIDRAFVDVDPAKPVFTHGVAVVYNGQLIGEKYAEGFDDHSRLMGWSMTKSITNALVGILVKDSLLSIEQKAPVAEWKDDERKNITINNLLEASTGLQWSESYFFPTSDFHKMFIKSDDKGAYAASLPLKHQPNTFFEYSSGTTNILSRIVRQTVGDNRYYKFPYERLFYKLGMTSMIMEPDASGTFVGSSYSFASARDWARFGLLYLNDGVWMGERILPEGWVKYTTTPAPAAPKRQYGAQWWLNLGDPANPQDVEYPGLPNESIIADGFERQFIVIVPSKNLVVVRLGVTHNKNFSMAKLVNDIIEALP